ncbi:small-conductance mechanosensitive channel [Novosphingobium sp. PhB165]|uniref:mechanosensitive ion channel domain-containing protein n=1 Tax=Novosphingobium sp. PhB165 TaxID=2485105 RepID=UPI001048EE72|nr:DUF3772 domain-containing protein [Novosphingobium sp. PhB165]TCM17114.1 small-conductance mechanosensitive channel [Novosphingobium sp. PhB165]
MAHRGPWRYAALALLALIAVLTAGVSGGPARAAMRPLALPFQAASPSPTASPEPAASPTPAPAALPADHPPLVDPETLANFNAAAAEAEVALGKPLGHYDYEEVHRLGKLRDRLAADRDRARQIADASNLDARIIQAQITALGPAPAEGKTEPTAITARRKELDGQLSVKLAPVLDAREAQARAATLVSELDERIATMERDRRRERTQSILDPRLWVDVAGDVRKGIDIAAREGAKGIAQDTPGHFAMRLLAVAGLVLLGPFASIRLLRIFRLRFAQRQHATQQATRRLILIVFEDVIAAIVLFFAIGCSVVAFAVLMRPFVDDETLAALSVLLLLAALVVAIAQWLAKSTLQSPFQELRLVRLRPELVDRAVGTVRLLGIVLALEVIIEGIEDHGFFAITVIEFLSALLLICGGALVWRFALLIDKGRDREPDDEGQGHEARVHHTGPRRPMGDPLDFTAPLGKILMLLAAGCALAAVIGYIVLAREIFSDLVVSVAIIAIAIFLHRLVSLIVGLLAEGGLRHYRASIHFVPMLAGIALTISVLPLLAITWGYNSREIGDALVTLRTGVTFGNVNVSAGDILTFAAVFFGGYIATRWIQRIVNLTILPQFEIDRGSQASIVTIIGYVGVVAAAAIAVASTGLDLTSLAFIATALSVGLGFGLQSTVENFTSGVILLVERPIREGDWIEVGTYSGIVRKVSVRSTHLESFDRHQIIIPNSQLITGSVKNLSLGERLARVVVPINVAYGSDLEKVRRVLIEIAKAQEGVLIYPEPSVTLDAFAENAMQMRLLVFVRDATDGSGTASTIRFDIARRFAEEGIEIPFPQMDVHVHGELRPAEPTPDEAPKTDD